MKKQVIKKLDDFSHIRLRLGMYAGSPTLFKEEIYLFKNNKFIKKEINYVSALIKIVNEIIDNSVDEAIRTKFQFANRIKVEMSEKSFKVIDNGRGIPVEKNEEGEYLPKVAWGNARSGSNFIQDNKRNTIGSHGIGSFIATVCGNYFKGISQDGKNKIICEWRNINKPLEYKQKITKSSKTGVEVYVEPDFSLFDSNQFTETDFKIIKTRLAMLKLTYPEIKFYLNGEQIIQPKDFEF